MRINFSHLHTHTESSLLDGIGSVYQYVDKAKKMGMKSFAITEHGNLNSSLKFYDYATSNNIKPILGCEFYVNDEIGKKDNAGKRVDRKKNHLIVLVKNKVGWNNILKLNNLSFKEDRFYYKPTISHKDLVEHGEGLIILSACIQGKVNQLILKDEIEKAEKMILFYKKYFGKDFYLELQINEIEGQKKVDDKLLEFSQKHNIKYVITNDVHYVDKSDVEIQDFVISVRDSKTIDKATKYSARHLYFNEPDDFYKFNERFKYNYNKEIIRKAIDTTNEVSEKIDNYIIEKKQHFPKFLITKEMKDRFNLKDDDKYKFLVKLCLEGLKKHKEENKIDIKKYDEYKFRLKKELDLIKKMDFTDYFLIVWDIVKFADDNNIMRGIARGSVGGSLVAYLLNITNLDPVRWETILERFLSFDRKDYPDIDLDFDGDKRHLIFEYLEKKYKNTIHIGTTQNFGVKNILRDYARVFNFPKEKVKIVDYICKTIQGYNVKPDDLIKFVADSETILEELPEIKKMIKVVKKIYGNARSFGSHASGLCITDEPIENILPINRSKNELITGYTEGVNRELSEIGVLKFDILGLKTITIFSNTIREIENTEGKETAEKTKYDLWNYEKWINNNLLIRELMKDNTGVFQFDSNSLWNFMKQVKPVNFKQLIDTTALFRPDVLESGQAMAYIERKNKGSMPPKIFIENKALKEITSKTQYCFVYQEQVMELLHRVFGFSMSEANLARKYISKKKKKELTKMLNEKIKDLDTFENKNMYYNKGQIKTLVDMLYEYGGYSFNYAHSVAYTIISYQGLYLRTKFKEEFYSSLINDNFSDSDKLFHILNSAKNMKIEIRMIDINKSEWKTKVVKENNKKYILLGFSLLKGFSKNAYREIQRIKEKQENGEIQKTIDFFKENFDGRNLNKKEVDAIIKLGIFDGIEKNRKKVFKIYKEIDKIKSSKKKKKKKNENENQINLLFNTNEFSSEIKEYISILDNVNKSVDKDFSIDEKIEYEKKYLGFVFFTDVFSDYKDYYLKLKQKGILTTLKDKKKGKFVFVYILNVKKIISKKGTELYFLTALDLLGEKEELMVFANLYKQTKIKEKDYCIIDFNTYKKNGKENYSVKSIKKITNKIKEDN